MTTALRELRTRMSPTHDAEDETMHLMQTTTPRSGKMKQISPSILFLRIVRDLRIRWGRMSTKSWTVAALVALPMLLWILLSLIDLCFRTYGPPHYASHETDFAVVINTYKRPAMMRQAVQHYAQTCGRRSGVAQVFIVWAEVNVQPPPVNNLFMDVKGKSQNRASVEFVRVSKDSLNSRFLPIASLQSSAIFMVDDDIRVDCFSLEQGFAAWRTYPHSMVGYYPRLSRPPRSAPSELVYHSWPMVYWQKQLNFILTKASFLHRDYMEAYSSPNHPQEIRDYVDQYFNCEDVAMSMLVANITRAQRGRVAPPVYVEASVSDKGLFGGISTGAGHMARRSDCLTDLSRIDTNHGWPAPLSQVFNLRDTTWVHHAPGLGVQYRPSNFFEWFALENVVKELWIAQVVRSLIRKFKR